MPNGQRRLLVAGLVLLDAAGMGIALTVAHRVASGHPWGAGGFAYVLSLAVVLPAAIALFSLNRLYVLDELLEGSVEYGRVIYACTLTAFGLIVLGFWGKILGEVAPSRRLVVLVWVLSVVLVISGRFLARRLIRLLRRRGYLLSRAVIMGAGGPGISLARHFQEVRHAGVQVVGFVDDYLPPGTPVVNGLQVLGPPSAVERIMHEAGANELIAVPTAVAWESFQKLIRSAPSLNGQTIRLVPDFRDILATQLKVHQLGFVPMLTVERIRVTGLDAFMKRLMDYGAAILVLPLALPVMALLAGILVRNGVRPPLRRVQALGRRGQPFSYWVFQTAQPGNRAQAAIYRLGLDRLPQLINVLLGQMSLVGPRPVPLEERRTYERWIPNLMTVKPGITGRWALYGANTVDEEMESNLFYIRNYTIWVDVEIMIRSFLRLLVGRPLRSPVGARTVHGTLPVHR